VVRRRCCHFVSWHFCVAIHAALLVSLPATPCCLLSDFLIYFAHVVVKRPLTVSLSC
jgi:hypothetical protein